MAETITGLALLRKEFPPNQISKLPKPKSKDSPKGRCPECGGWHGLPAVHLDYVGHAALTDRLLDADPSWSWEPLALDDKGLPAIDGNGGMWIKLTVCGVTRLGYGDAQGKTGGDAMKERIGDALRNAAMRFGAALDLWHKGDLHAHEEEPQEPQRRPVQQAASITQDVRANPKAEAFAALQPEQQHRMRQIAEAIKREGANFEKIAFVIDMAGLDNDEKVGLWHLLDSSTRAGIKKHNEKSAMSPLAKTAAVYEVAK